MSPRWRSTQHARILIHPLMTVWIIDFPKCRSGKWKETGGVGSLLGSLHQNRRGYCCCWQLTVHQQPSDPSTSDRIMWGPHGQMAPHSVRCHVEVYAVQKFFSIDRGIIALSLFFPCYDCWVNSSGGLLTKAFWVWKMSKKLQREIDRPTWPKCGRLEQGDFHMVDSSCALLFLLPLS